MATSTQFSILDLPDEMIAVIVEQVDTVTTLVRLASTCHRLQDIAERRIYRHLFIRLETTLKHCYKSTQNRPGRAKAIQTLHTPCSTRDWQSFSTTELILLDAKNLKELIIESPQCNGGTFEGYAQWRLMHDHIFMPMGRALEGRSTFLQRLEKVEIHLNGPESPYWTFNETTLSILLHPTLKELKLSCVNILDEVYGLARIASGWRSVLKKLVLVECNFTHHGLLGLLRLPKALETMYLGENCHNIVHFRDNKVDNCTNHLFMLHPTAVVAALKWQQHSLQSLTYVTNYLSPMHTTYGNPIDGAFADFDRLEDITLVGCCPFFERAVLSMTPPPNLKHLTFQSERPFRDLTTPTDDHAPNSLQFTLADIPFLRTPSVSIPPTLETLEVVYEHQFLPWFRDPTDLTIPGIAERFFIRKAADEVEKVGVGLELRVYEMTCGGGQWFYPPLLYGEAEPVKELVHADGAFVGRYKVSEQTGLDNQRAARRPSNLLLGDW